MFPSFSVGPIGPQGLDPIGILIFGGVFRWTRHLMRENYLFFPFMSEIEKGIVSKVRDY